MEKEVNKVWSTNDYSKFKFMKSNRELRLSHVAELKESIKENPLEKPIDVNEKMEIIDGQHRYFAWQELGMPIVYIIHKGWGEKEVPILNTNQKNWLPSDFVKMYCEAGNNDYIQYKEFSERYGFIHHANVILLAGRGHDTTKDFNEGRFRVTKWHRANIMAKNLVELKEYYGGYKRSNFVSAYLNLAADPKFDHQILMDKLSYQSRKLVDCTTTKEFYELLREIYNFKSRNESRISKEF
jgi:hypothetical protein